uniref:Uncharacterized protein n=1 Tax=Manihot esculenta TaxID=3983 RepID=A0A2C9W3E4_MANES
MQTMMIIDGQRAETEDYTFSSNYHPSGSKSCQFALGFSIYNEYPLPLIGILFSQQVPLSVIYM